MRKIAILAGLALGLGALAGGSLYWFATKQEYSPPASERDIQEGHARMSGPISPTPAPAPLKPGHAVRLAIGNLGLPEEQNRVVSDLLLAALSQRSGVELVERQSLEQVLTELQLSLSGLVRAKDALQVGKLVRAEWFLLGTPLSSQGTNFIVVRVVDATTGIFRESASIQVAEPPAQVAEQLAGFILRCREHAGLGRATSYLAFGSFLDLSLNNRQAHFPGQLRSYLTAAYSGARVTLLERDHMDVLLQEIQLDLAGLTDHTGASPAVMQTAVWLVEGDYQGQGMSEVELALRVNRVFGRSTVTNLQGVPDSQFFEKAKLALDHIIAQAPQLLYPTLASEVRLQMRRGMELARLQRGILGLLDNSSQLTSQELEIQRRKVEEAIRAFKTVLLLDRTNRAAKVFLGACYCKAGIDRTDEGRAMFRTVLEEPTEDEWREVALRRLKDTFRWTGARERFEWYAEAKSRALNPSTRAIFEKEFQQAEEAVKFEEGAGLQPDAVAEKKLRDDVRDSQAFLEDKGGRLPSAFGLYDHAQFFSPDRKRAEENLTKLLPELVTEFPKVAPHLAATALSFQHHTNGPIVQEFLRQLDRFSTHPEGIIALPYFWNTATDVAYRWGIQHRRPDLAVRIMESRREAAASNRRVGFNDEDRVALAFAYRASGHWDQALAAFLTITNTPVVEMGREGPWGEAFTAVSVVKEADFCRERLGKAPAADPRKLAMDPRRVCMHGASAFAASRDCLWVAVRSQLLQLSFDLRTNKVVALPAHHSIGIYCVLAARGKVWVATDGDGLFEYDEASGHVQQYNEKDGLKKDVIATLCLAGETLWIGYGVPGGLLGYGYGRPEGGLGLFDLRKKEFRSFTPRLGNGNDASKEHRGPEPLDAPTHRIVRAIAPGSDSDIWFLAAGSPLRRFQARSNTWDGVREISGCGALAADATRLYIGSMSATDVGPGPVGISILNHETKVWTHLADLGVLPSNCVSAIALDGNRLWLASTGFIAAIDLSKNQLVHYAPIPAQGVHSLQLGGGYIWAQYNDHLHRAKLP